MIKIFREGISTGHLLFMRGELAGRYSTQSTSMSTTRDGLLFLKLLTLSIIMTYQNCQETND